MEVYARVGKFIFEVMLFSRAWERCRLHEKEGVIMLFSSVGMGEGGGTMLFSSMGTM